MANGDNGFDCLGAIFVILIIGGVVLEFLRNVWIAVSNFFSNLWASIVGVLPLIGEILGVVVVILIAAGFVLLIIQEIQAFFSARKNRIAAERRENVRKAKEQAWRDSPIGQNTMAIKEMTAKKEAVLDEGKRMLEEWNSLSKLVARMDQSLLSKTLKKWNREQTEKDRAGTLIQLDDLQRRIGICNGQIEDFKNELERLKLKKFMIDNKHGTGDFNSRREKSLEVLAQTEKYLVGGNADTRGGYSTPEKPEDGIRKLKDILDSIEIRRLAECSKKHIETPLDLTEFNTVKPKFSAKKKEIRREVEEEEKPFFKYIITKK